MLGSLPDAAYCRNLTFFAEPFRYHLPVIISVPEEYSPKASSVLKPYQHPRLSTIQNITHHLSNN
jgi:hypothetical protein